MRAKGGGDPQAILEWAGTAQASGAPLGAGMAAWGVLLLAAATADAALPEWGRLLVIATAPLWYVARSVAMRLYAWLPEVVEQQGHRSPPPAGRGPVLAAVMGLAGAVLLLARGLEEFAAAPATGRVGFAVAAACILATAVLVWRHRTSTTANAGPSMLMYVAGLESVFRNVGDLHAVAFGLFGGAAVVRGCVDVVRLAKLARTRGSSA